jgi:hypothetical protein
MIRQDPEIAALAGLWQRTLMVWPDGRRDTEARVHWLQGASLYADLRQPAECTNCRAAACLRELRMAHIAWLARQEGFAGALHSRGGFFQWDRTIDFQPAARYADAGRLRFEGPLLIEEGQDIAYTEHWRREPAEARPCAAARLRDRETGCAGFMIRAGTRFMIARDRSVALPPHRMLSELVAATMRLEDAQDIVDCEISLGRLDHGGWLVERSSLPFKEWWRPSPRQPARTDRFIDMCDLQADGRPYDRRWDVIDVEGSLDDLWSPAGADHSLSQVPP